MYGRTYYFVVGAVYRSLKIVHPLDVASRKKIQLKRRRFSLLSSLMLSTLCTTDSIDKQLPSNKKENKAAVIESDEVNNLNTIHSTPNNY